MNNWKPGPGAFSRLSPEDKRTIWLRYALYAHNRPGIIAADYGITEAYVIKIGKRKDPCQPPPSPSRSPKSHLISSQRTLNGQSATGAKAGSAS